MRIFLDANVLIAAAGNSDGGSAYLCRVARQEGWHLLSSAYVLREARTNVAKKLPLHQGDFEALLSQAALCIVTDASKTIRELCCRVVPEKDVPVLAAAILSKSDILCTLDRRDFHKQTVRNFCRSFDLKIQAPKELLEAYVQTDS